jgi:hypothetical protein
MRVLGSAIAGALITWVSVAAEPIPSIATRDTPTVDLGYSVYSGSYDATNNINVFKGYDSNCIKRIETRIDMLQRSICRTATWRAQMGSSTNTV